MLLTYICSSPNQNAGFRGLNKVRVSSNCQYINGKHKCQPSTKGKLLGLNWFGEKSPSTLGK